MQIEMKRALYVPAVAADEAKVWTVVKRMLLPYIDIVTKPAAEAGSNDVVIEYAETLDQLLLNWGEALVRCSAMDDQPELAEFADMLAEAVQVALDSIEDNENFLTAVNACLAQVYSADLVVLADENGETQYEVVYRALRGEDEYAVLMPTDGDSDGGALVLRCIYDDETPAFDDADEEIGESVFDEFMQEFAEEFGEEE